MARKPKPVGNAVPVKHYSEAYLDALFSLMRVLGIDRIQAISITEAGGEDRNVDRMNGRALELLREKGWKKS